ncbi:hypothetical protein HOY80DRAFT_1134461 [Tuber brumale]|nr:hypothetical protein HOY80DRAFT_1134461 [Tuber brumale]
MGFPPKKNTLYKLDASFSEVRKNRLEFTGGAVKSPGKPSQAPSFPSPSQDVRLVPVPKTPPPPASPVPSKGKGSVRFANEIKVDYLFYPNKPVDQPVRMRREIYDDEEGVFLYNLEICEEGLEKMWNIPHRTVRCQVNGKKGMIERLNKEKQHHEELELAGYGHSGDSEAEDKDMNRAAPVNHKMKSKSARLREELKEEQLLDPAELEITRITAQNTRMNAGAVNISELRGPRMGNKRRHHILSPIIPLPLGTPENASDRRPKEYQREKARAAQPRGGKPGDPLRVLPDNGPKTDPEPGIVHQKRVPKSKKSGIGTEKFLQWDEYLKAKEKKSAEAHEKGRGTPRNTRKAGKKQEDTK